MTKWYVRGGNLGKKEMDSRESTEGLIKKIGLKESVLIIHVGDYHTRWEMVVNEEYPFASNVSELHLPIRDYPIEFKDDEDHKYTFEDVFGITDKIEETNILMLKNILKMLFTDNFYTRYNHIILRCDAGAHRSQMVALYIKEHYGIKDIDMSFMTMEKHGQRRIIKELLKEQ